MKPILTALLILPIVALLAGCHTLYNHDNNYLRADSEPALKMPKGVSDTNFKDSYPIPKTDLPDPTLPASLVPPGLAEDQAAAKQASKHASKAADNDDKAQAEA